MIEERIEKSCGSVGLFVGPLPLIADKLESALKRATALGEAVPIVPLPIVSERLKEFLVGRLKAVLRQKPEGGCDRMAVQYLVLTANDLGVGSYCPACSWVSMVLNYLLLPGKR